MFIENENGARIATTILGCEYCGWFRGIGGYPNSMCDFYGLKQMIGMINQAVMKQSAVVKCVDGIYKTDLVEAIAIINSLDS